MKKLSLSTFGLLAVLFFVTSCSDDSIIADPTLELTSELELDAFTADIPNVQDAELRSFDDRPGVLNTRLYIRAMRLQPLDAGDPVGRIFGSGYTRKSNGEIVPLQIRLDLNELNQIVQGVVRTRVGWQQVQYEVLPSTKQAPQALTSIVAKKSGFGSGAGLPNVIKIQVDLTNKPTSFAVMVQEGVDIYQALTSL